MLVKFLPNKWASSGGIGKTKPDRLQGMPTGIRSLIGELATLTWKAFLQTDVPKDSVTLWF